MNKNCVTGVCPLCYKELTSNDPNIEIIKTKRGGYVLVHKYCIERNKENEHKG